jgi:hypothetical protein
MLSSDLQWQTSIFLLWIWHSCRLCGCGLRCGNMFWFGVQNGHRGKGKRERKVKQKQKRASHDIPMVNALDNSPLYVFLLKCSFVPTLQMKVRAVFWVCILLYSSATNMEMSKPGWLQWPQWDAWCQETAEWGGCYALVCDATKTQSWKDATPIPHRWCVHIQGGPPWHRLFILSWNSWRVFWARAGAYLVSTQAPQTSDWLCQQFSYVIK